MRVVITGAGGQLGHAVRDRFAAEADVVALTRQEADLARADLGPAIAGLRPGVIVNCAAWTDVDGAEDHPVEALEANALGVLRLARAAAASNAVFVHMSTDFVFDGVEDRPHRESDPPKPQGTYALTKLLGEWLALDYARAYVLRVESLFGGPKTKSSIDRIIDGLAAGSRVPVFSDRTVSPTYAIDAADAIAALVTRGAPAGLYHCVNTGAATWEGMGRAILEMMQAPGSLEPKPMASVSMRVKRPLYCALSNDKLRDAGVDMPTWQDAVARHLDSRGLLRKPL